MRYLSVTDVISMAEAEVGPDVLVSFGLLESAVMRPQAGYGEFEFYPDAATKAAALFHSLIRNHPFVDGNKRVALVATAAFLRLNGFVLLCEPGQPVALANDVAEGSLDVEAIAGQLKQWMSALVPDDWDDEAD